MARKPLRSQLNQIRAWVRQGRTDAWIAHQLDIPTSELREFRRRHELAPEAEGGEVELRDEIEAEIEATLGDDEHDEDDEPEEDEPADDGDGGGDRDDEDEGEREPEGEREREPDDEDEGSAADGDEAPAGGRRRRRRRRRRSGAPRAGAAMQGTFDHGKDEGFGLWLDPAVEEDPVYTEHWAGHRPVEVTIEPDRIVIKRS